MGPQADWPLWFGNVLLVSILLLVPKRIWPALIVAAFAAFTVNEMQSGSTLRATAVLIFADAVDVLTAALCLSYAFEGVPRLNSVRALAKFSLCAVILPPLLGASISALALSQGRYWVSFRIAFFSEAIAYLTLTPAILGWFGQGPERFKKSRAHYLEAATLFVGLVVVAYLAFTASVRHNSEALLYSLVPFLLWSALRFGTTGVSTSVIAISVLAIWGATHGRGLFSETGPLNNVWSLQLFLFFAAAPFMVLAAVVEDNKQASEQLFRSIFENAQTGISFLNIQTGEHFSNRVVEEMLGYSQEELPRVEQWDELVHPDERASGAKRFADITQGKRDKDEWEQRFIRRDGRLVTAKRTCKLIRDTEGKPKFVVTLDEDVTDRRLAEADRVRIAKQMQLLLDSTGQGIYGLDLDGRCTLINKAMGQMIGFQLEEVLGRNMHELVHHHRPDGSPYPLQECPVFQAIKSGKGCSSDEEIIWRRDGVAMPVEYSSFPVMEEGSIKGAVVTVSDITERKRAREALQSSERLFRSIFENSQIGISFFNIDGRAVFTNHAFQEMLGYTESELSQLEKWDEIIHPEERFSGAERYAKLVQGLQEKDEWEQRFVRRDGRMVLANARFSLIRDAGGKPQYVASLTEDITEKKQAEEKLEDSEQLFRSIFEGTQVGIGVYRIDTNEHFSNRALHEMLGYTGEELSRLEQWDAIVPEEDRDSCAERYAELVEGTRETDEYQQRFIRRDGRMVLGNGKFQLLRDSVGKPHCIVGLTEDITERARAKEALQASERLFRSIFENAQIGISVFDAVAGQFYSNQALHEMLGCTHDDLSSIEKWDLVVHPDERASGARRYAELLSGERDKDSWEQKFLHCDGRVVIANGRFSVVRDDSRKVSYVLNLTEDITDRKRAEAELVTAKEAAVAATRAKSDFLANMSHEIRTPMNAILGMTHLALKTELTPKQHDYLTKTKAAAEALLGIINDILDFSKIEAGKLTMEQAEFRLDAVLDNLSTVVSQKAQEKNLEFLVAAPQNLPPVLVGDPLRLGQVLINLVNNAVKFTQRGEIVVTVKLEERISDRIKLKFTVQDSGIGMTPKQIARLFQAFSQADTSTTRKYGGTGLGLSISKRLVEMMEGNIWAESEHGQGSTFCFTGWFGVGATERRPKVLPPRLAGIRVLVVDDNPVAREILADVLRQFTVRVDCVSSGNDALRELAKTDTQDPYQLVLMDWQMPGLDGLETSRRIKRRGNLCNVPKIVMITAFGREEIPLSVQEMEIEAVLQKPVTPSVLFDTLMSLFGEAGDEKTAEAPERSDRDLPRVSGIRVLLVEDNEVNQQVATELLESEGAKVTIANHGAEAVKLLTQGVPPPPFDIVLMDLQMPEMDGLTATRILRAQPHLEQLPIIAMTAHAMAEEVQRCLDAGMNDHVGKPIDPGTFFATIARWTRAHRQEVLHLPVRAPSAEGEIILPQIGGVDVAAGLQRVAGNKRLYCGLLTQFAVKHESAGIRIRQALASGDRSKAERLTHSLKGSAGNLAMKEIFDLAGRLERAIRDRDAGVEDLIATLVSALHRQIRNIHAAFSVTIDESQWLEVPPRAAAGTAKTLAQLKELLEANDADALEVFQSIADQLRSTVASSQLEALRAAINGFHFEEALDELNRMVTDRPPKEQAE
jgi:PAS domain S-box-containing protein